MTRRKKQRKPPQKKRPTPRKKSDKLQPNPSHRRFFAMCLGLAVLMGLVLLLLVQDRDGERADSSRLTPPKADAPSAEEQPVPAETTAETSALTDSINVDQSTVDESPQSQLTAGPTKFQSFSKVKGVDPSEDGWDSEFIHDQIHDQFDLLRDWLHSSAAAGDLLSAIVADEFRCQSLRPSKLHPKYESDSIAVFSPQPATESSQTSPYHGADGFATALHDVLEPLAPGLDLHAEFKVIGNAIRDAEVETQILVHFSGSDDEGAAVQINTVWQADWALSEERPPLLLRLRAAAEDFELAIANLPERALLSDCTRSVLAGNESYGRQLQHGVSHWVSQFDSSVGITLHDSLGLAIGDVNGDELPDLYVCQSAGLANRLFLHQADGTLVDASAESGADFCDHTGQPLLVDLNNDGDQDLVLIILPEIVVLEGDGAGHFQVRNRYPISGNGVALSAVDFNVDGLLDLYVCVRDDDPSTKLAQGLLGSPVPYHDANNGGPNVMFRNEGGLRFRDVTSQVGLDENNSRFSQAVCWEDYDNDGDLDAYVANDFGRNNLYRNDYATTGKFTDVAAEAGVEDMSAGMSVSWADYDNDGWTDLYVGNMFSSAGNRVTFQRQFKPGAEQSTVDAFRRHARGNTLFRNLGDGTFEDVSETAGVTMGRWAWASSLVDLNNDSWQDILVANGFITGYQTDDL